MYVFRTLIRLAVLATITLVPQVRADDAVALNDFLGPMETSADGHRVNASAEYWTGIVGVAFDRDIDLQVPPTPLDLDLDRRPDTTYSADWRLKGGLLAHPDAAGFVPTPDDPKGRVGAFSISTGFLGVREEMDPITHQGTGRYGFNCWCCHASADEHGHILIGRPNTRINLGLIMASSRVMDPKYVITAPRQSRPMSPDELRAREHLDKSFDFDRDHDGCVTIDEWRSTMRLPPARVARAMLLLAGPGRLDQSVDQRMDGFIPLANLQQYWYQKRGPKKYLQMEAQPKVAAFNPVSIPAAISGLGVKHYSWTGKDSSMKFDAEGIASRALHITAERLADLMHVPHEGPIDPERLNRALTLDFRNVGTAGRETDSVAADGWTTMMLTHPDPRAMTSIPDTYGAFLLYDELTKGRETPVVPAGDELATEGLRIFTEREVGETINERVVYGREALLPKDARSVAALVPIDRSRPMNEKVPVRCATCHNHSPLKMPMPLSAPIPVMQRCDICHYDHPIKDQQGRFQPLSAWIQKKALADFEACIECHEAHPDFGPQVYSNSWLMPFDADGNGETHHDEAGDLIAGGIGTDAMLNIDSLFVRQLVPAARRRDRTTYAISPDAMHRPERVEYSTVGFGFVRVAPLISLRETAPYLHNGSVPTLDALLSDGMKRPVRFRVGADAERFEFDTTLPGNHNTGHEYGTNLKPDEKRALIHFLETLP
ncbi:MAG: hypothetical protein H6818_09085 [Phycisphaerales bacterium]|nr:hypothetical protein [Phycisphaerales bacterium]MCB9862724.1 hypothetical protein [Phycisphaerales bacterium]